MENIRNRVFAVERYFDNVFDGYYSPKYLTKEEAVKQLKEANQIRSRYYSYSVKKHLAILGIVKFNEGKAYVFNINPNISYDQKDLIKITGGNFEELMNCYVYRGLMFPKNKLKKLEEDYYNNGGVFFEKYHDYEKKVLNKIREHRQKEFRNTIVEDIFKHNFREIKKNTWSNKSGVIIKQTKFQRLSVNHSSFENIMDIDCKNHNEKVLINSIFSKHVKNINQIGEKNFCIPCNTNDRRDYHFTCFEIKLN